MRDGLAALRRLGERHNATNEELEHLSLFFDEAALVSAGVGLPTAVGNVGAVAERCRNILSKFKPSGRGQVHCISILVISHSALDRVLPADQRDLNEIEASLTDSFQTEWRTVFQKWLAAARGRKRVERVKWGPAPIAEDELLELDTKLSVSATESPLRDVRRDPALFSIVITRPSLETAGT